MPTPGSLAVFQCLAHVRKAHALLLKAHLIAPQVGLQSLVVHHLLLRGEEGELRPCLFRLPHPEGFVVHQEGGAVGKDGSQLVRDGKAVGVQVSPVEDGYMREPGDFGKVFKAVPCPEEDKGMGNRGKGEEVCLVFGEQARFRTHKGALVRLETQVMAFSVAGVKSNCGSSVPCG